MKNYNYLLGGLGLGAGLMYLFDPGKGKRRRALIRDQANRLANVTAREFGKVKRDVQNQARGFVAETEHVFSKKEFSDQTIDAHVRAKLGRLVTHPHSVGTKVENGKLTLSGPILENEACGLLCALGCVDGIKEVEDKLQRYDSLKNLPLDENGRAARRRFSEMLETRWSPPVRVAAAIVGAGFAAYSLKHKDLLGAALGAAGFGLLSRSMVNKPIENLVRRNPHGISVQKTMNIEAPIRKVFEVCAHPERFPEFMSHVREVVKLADDHYRWTVDGVAGLPLTWETRVLKVVPDELIRWRSTDDSTIKHFGELRLEKTSDKKTRLSVLMRYQPPAGIFGHWVATVFGRDPKSEMDDDILRMKTFIEKEKVPRDSVTQTQSRKWRKILAKDAMTRNPSWLHPESPVYEAAELMREKDCGAIPILENAATMKVVGIITDRDIACRVVAAERDPFAVRVGEVMTRSPFTLHMDATIEDCRKVMDQYQVRRVLIVDEKGACRGIVAMADIARFAPEHEIAELAKDVSKTFAVAA